MCWLQARPGSPSGTISRGLCLSALPPPSCWQPLLSEFPLTEWAGGSNSRLTHPCSVSPATPGGETRISSSEVSAETPGLSLSGSALAIGPFRSQPLESGGCNPCLEVGRGGSSGCRYQKEGLILDRRDSRHHPHPHKSQEERGGGVVSNVSCL